MENNKNIKYKKLYKDAFDEEMTKLKIQDYKKKYRKEEKIGRVIILIGLIYAFILFLPLLHVYSILNVKYLAIVGIVIAIAAIPIYRSYKLKVDFDIEEYEKNLLDMNKDEKFKELYKDLLDKSATKLEMKRQEVLKEEKINDKLGKRLLIIGSLLALITIAIMGKLNLLDNMNGKMGVSVIAIIILIMMYIFYRLKKDSGVKKEYEDAFKNEIIEQLIKSFNDTFEYKPYEAIPASIYDKAQFKRYNYYSSSELMTGTIDKNCKMNLAEVVAKYQNEEGNTITYFAGLFAQIETPKPFETKIYLRENLEDTTFDELKIELDSQEFEEIFDIYASDKIVAMQLLTADIMEMMIEFYKSMNIYFEITIKNNYIYIRTHSGNNFEVTPLNSFALDKNVMYEYYKILEFTFKLTNTLVNLIDETPY